MESVLKNIISIPILSMNNEINNIERIQLVEEWIGEKYFNISMIIKERKGLVFFKNSELLESSRTYVLENGWTEISLSVFLTPNACIVDFSVIPN